MRSIYGARIEAVRRTLPKRDQAVAVKSLRDERKATIRAVTERRQRAKTARRLAWLMRRPAPPEPSAPK